MTWTSGRAFPARTCFRRGGEKEGQAGWAQHKKTIFRGINVVNALGDPVLAVRNRHYEAQRVYTLHIFRAYLFIVPLEKFGTSANAAVQCTGEENRTRRGLDAAACNNLIRFFSSSL